MHWFGVVAAALAVVACNPAREGGPEVDDAGESASTSGTDALTEPSPDTGADSTADEPGRMDGPQVCEGEGTWQGDDGGGTFGDSGSTGGPSDGPVGMSDDMPLSVTIEEIQQGMVAYGKTVAVEGALVTGRRVPSDSGLGFQLWVQDPAGGPWSGLRVLLPGEPPAMELELGDEVYLLGEVRILDEYVALRVTDVAGGLVYVGQGMLPPPAVVSIDDLHLGDEDGRAYEGIPVRVEQVVVTDDDPCDGEFVIDNIARVDDRFVPGELAAPPTGSMLAAVEGVLIYAVDALEIAPRDPSEVQ